jgi:LuxR family maltose regulon positive regulatory protein
MDSQSPSQQILEYLENENLFIVPLDDERCWYRYHRLFSDLLRKRLQHTYGDLALTLHLRASEWHEQQGLMPAAIDHALAGEAHHRAVLLIEESVEATFMRSEIATILGWVERLPAGPVCSHPTLCFFHSWALLMSGRSLGSVEQRLQDIVCAQDDPALREVMAGRVAALRAYSALLQGDMPQATELCSQALETLPEGDRLLRSVVTWVLSLARLWNGSLRDGSQELGEVARMGQELGNPLIAVTALCFQARLQTRQGRLHEAKVILERALQLATDQQGCRLPIASEALIGLGELRREWNDLGAATDCLAEGIELARQWSEVSAFDAYGPLARIRAAQGDFEGAGEAIETAQGLARKSEATDVDDQVVALLQARLWIVQGDVDRATRWAERRGLIPGASTAPTPEPDRSQPFISDRMRKYEQEVLARLFILQGRTAQALDLLEQLLAEARRLGRTDLVIDVQILRALVFQAEGRDGQAMIALVEALDLAEPGGYVRIFLDEGPAMASLLRRAASRGIAPTYVMKLLAAFDEAEPSMLQSEAHYRHPQLLIEPLSEREMEVLLLLARGMSNPEIAEHLYIAVSTVRSHCKSIYAKLNVHKRWDAVQRAQELGLL